MTNNEYSCVCIVLSLCMFLLFVLYLHSNPEIWTDEEGQDKEKNTEEFEWEKKQVS